MNAARILARCSRFMGHRGLLTALDAGKGGLMGAPSRVVAKPNTSALFLRPMSSSAKFEVINIQDEADFKSRVLGSSTPIVVDFHATWCGPCKLLGPRLESLLSKEGGKVLMAKVDIDDNPELAMEYGVRSVPTVVGVKNGKVLDQFIGVVDDDQISSFVDKLTT